MNKSSNNKKQKGQGLVEYSLILVLVAVVVIAVLLILGPTIGNIFTKVNSGVAGAASGPKQIQNYSCYTGQNDHLPYYYINYTDGSESPTYQATCPG